jgi:PAS domain S-box-containing protein
MQLNCVQEEQKRQDTEDRLQFILQSAGIGTWDFYPMENKVYCDDICKKLYGFSTGDVVSYTKLLKRIHPEDVQRVDKAVKEAIDPQQCRPYDIIFRTIGAEDKQLHWLQCKGKAYFDDNGEAYRFSGTAQDITEGLRRNKVLEDMENRFQLAFDNASLGIVLTDYEGRFLLVNKAYSNITGYSQEELHSHSFSFITHPDDLEWNSSVVSSLKSGEIDSFDINKRYIRKDGCTIWVNHQATMITGKDGIERTIFSIVRDVTADMQAREDLESSLEGGELGLWHVDLAKRTIALDAYCRELLELPDNNGFNYEEILACIDENEKEEVRRKIVLAMKSGTDNNFDVEFRSACTSEQRWVRMKGRVVLSQNKVYRLAGTMQDISAQKQLQQYRDNFLGIASHELKTPVTTIKTYAQLLDMLLKQSGNPEIMHMIKRMNAQVDKLTGLINELLDITKLQAGKLQFSDGFFNFNTMVDEVVDALQLTTATHNILKQFSNVGDVYGDRERISQVVTNLLTNAIKYSPNAERINVYTSLQNKDVMLCVEDFGIGIPEENRQKVFEQYYRVNGKAQHTIPGLGLGLFISSEIIKREGGRIWVRSEEGKGSTFCFTIPKDHREE